MWTALKRSALVHLHEMTCAVPLSACSSLLISSLQGAASSLECSSPPSPCSCRLKRILASFQSLVGEWSCTLHAQLPTQRISFSCGEKT